MDLRTPPRPRPAVPGRGPGRLAAAEAALVRHYRRLVCLAYLVLPADRGRHARVTAAHAAVQRALPSQFARGRAVAAEGDDGYPAARVRVLRAALRGRRWAALPRVAGVRVFTPAGEADAELDARLAELTPSARAAFALLALDGLDRAAAAEVLAAAGVATPLESARAGAELLDAVGDLGCPDGELPAAYDACAVHLRPGDLLRRRRAATALSAAAVLALLAAAVPLPGPPAPPPSAATPSAPASAPTAVPPVRRAADLWQHTARLGLAVWPARGELVDDSGLVQRAEAAWRSSAQPPAGSGGVQLLYAGRLDGATVVALTDGVRLARYTEEPSGPGGAGELESAAADDSDVTAGAAVLLRRTGAGGRYLLAPWIAAAATRRLDRPDQAEQPLSAPDGVTAPVPGTAAGGCPGPVLQLRSASTVAEQHAFLLADVGGLVPAHLTYTPPPDGSGPARPPREAVGAQALHRWAAGACAAPEVASGVRQLNLWEFADQSLPQGAGELAWVCLRADHWDGSGSAAAVVLPPGGGAVRLARADGRACSRYEQDTVAQYRWRSPGGAEYLLVAVSRRVARLTVTTPKRRLDQAAPAGRTLAVDDPGPGPSTVEAVTTGGVRLRPLG